MTHGYAVARRAVEERLAARLKRGEKTYLERVKAGLDDPEPEAVYICCFCARGDLLSQWRGYGANGTGVSLEFDPRGFDFVTGSDSPPYGLLRLWSVFYDANQQAEIMREAVRFGWEAVGSPEAKASRALQAIRFFIPTFKHADFKDEQELRLIFTPHASATPPPPPPDFRVARGMLVPYYRLQALMPQGPPRSLPLRKVRVGPSPNKRGNAEGVRMLLDANGSSHVEVVVSTTPYRG